LGCIVPQGSAEPVAAGTSGDGTLNPAEEASQRLQAAHTVKDVLAAAQEHLLVSGLGDLDAGRAGNLQRVGFAVSAKATMLKVVVLNT
jgi:hypothetical protein